MLVKKGQMEYNTQSYDEIPDMWHIAQNHPDKNAREAILKAWHTAHAYRDALNKIGRPDIHAVIEL